MVGRMPEAADLDLPTLVSLAGTAANEHLLDLLHRAGFEGIRISHGYVIQHLIESQPTIGELAERLGVTQQAVSKTIAELEGLGYVSRWKDDFDSRVRRVGLTDRGRAMLAQSRADRAELDKAVGSDLSEAKRVLVRLLEETGSLEAIVTRTALPPSD
jgi:DNA-binding MarR family transcriptional regulator